MHNLTKALVVLTALLSVGLSSLTMAFSVNADRIKAEYENLLDSKNAAESQLSNETARSSQAVTRLEEDKENLRAQLNQQTAELRSLRSERAELRQARDEAVQSEQALKAQLGNFTKTVESQSALIENYRTEVGDLRDNELGYRREILNLEDRLNDLESQRTVLESSLRATKELLAEARVRMEELDQGFASSGDTGPRDFTIPVRGKILNVREGANGQVLAEINLGSNDGLKTNVRLNVGRNGKFIANLVVIEVDLQRAVGRVEFLTSSGGEVRVNDTVLSKVGS